jgi:hypothetical protein
LSEDFRNRAWEESVLGQRESGIAYGSHLRQGRRH